MGRSLEIIYPDDDTMDGATFNATLGPLLLQGGLQLDDQFKKLNDLISQNASSYNATDLDEETAQIIQNELTAVWFLRLLMSTTVYSYIVSWLVVLISCAWLKSSLVELHGQRYYFRHDPAEDRELSYQFHIYISGTSPFAKHGDLSLTISQRTTTASRPQDLSTSTLMYVCYSVPPILY